MPKMTIERRLSLLEVKALEIWKKQIENESGINTLFSKVDKLEKSMRSG